jgi:hypothetical protein
LELLSSLKGPLGTAAAFTKRLSDLAQQLKSGTVTMDTVKNFLVETGAGALEAMGEFWTQFVLTVLGFSCFSCARLSWSR